MADCSLFRAPGYLRGLALFALVASPLLGLLSFLAWWVDGARIGLWMVPLWLGMTCYWAWQWRLWARQFRLYADRLEIETPWGSPARFWVAELQALQLAQGGLRLSTHHGTVHLRGEPNTLAQLAAALQAGAPTLRQAHTEQPLLPIQIDAPRQPVIIMNVFGLLVGALGMGLGNAALTDAEFSKRTLALLFALLMLSMTAILLYWLLVIFVWRYAFDAAEIRVHHSLRTVRYDPAQLCNMALEQRPVTVRGFTKTLYTLRLDFEEGSWLVVKPGGQNYPFEYVESHEQLLLTRLRGQLQNLYHKALSNSLQTASFATSEGPPTAEAVTVRQLDPATDWQPMAGEDLQRPDYIVEHYSRPADLRVAVQNHGERQPGAETVYLQLSRPVEGQQRFRTTNGDACFSQSGRLLLLKGPFLLIAVDAHTLQAWHYRLRMRTMLLGAQWQGEELAVRIIGYGQRVADAEVLGPWGWTHITTTWTPGLGGAAAGDFAQALPAPAASADLKR